MFECEICDGQDSREILLIKAPDSFEQSAGLTSLGYKRYWLECLQCGAATNILPEDSALRLASLRSAYYKVDFANSDIAEKYQLIRSLPYEQSDNAMRVARIIDFQSRWSGALAKPAVMDIGAGIGVFLSHLVDQTKGAWHYLGVESDPCAAAFLRQLKKFTVVDAIFHGQTELRGFNLITLNKVLEHIEHSLQFLLQVRQSLVMEDGLLYIEVPDKLTTRLCPPHDNILGALHCHLYDHTSLFFLLRRAGLEPLCANRISEPSGKLSVYAFAAPIESLKRKRLPYE